MNVKKMSYIFVSNSIILNKSLKLYTHTHTHTQLVGAKPKIDRGDFITPKGSSLLGVFL